MKEYYKVSLSNKESIFIDHEDYRKLLDKIENRFVLINGELINTAFIISITKSKDVPEKYLPKKKIVGHIDNEKGVYVVDSVEYEDGARLIE